MRQASVNAGVLAALVLSVLAVSGLPAGAASTSMQASEDYVVGAQHTTDVDFNSADTLQNLNVSDGGISLNTSKTYNAVRDSTTGNTTDDRSIAGDGPDDELMATEWRLDPTISGSIDTVTLDMGNSGGSDYGMSVDIYAVQESPDDTHEEGQLVKSDWNPSFAQGPEEIVLDSSFNVVAGETWTLEFVTRNTDNDGNADTVRVKTYDDNDAPNWATHWEGGSRSWVGDITLDGGAAGTSQYDSTYFAITNGSQAALNITAAQDVSIDTTITGSDGSVLAETTLTTAANHTLSLEDASEYDKLYSHLTINTTGDDPAFRMDDESILFTNHAPEADNLSPPDGTELNSSSVDFTADVSDAEFPTAQGDEVTAELFVDGESVGSQSVTSNQTVSVNHELSEGGDHTYHWELTDSYGETTTTSTRTVAVPSTLEIRDVTNTSKLVDGDNATVTFYGGDDEREIVERPAEDGTVSLDGLPTDTEFTVVVRADDYYTRQTIIPSLYDQSNIWMLPKNGTDAVEIVFLLDDRTGDFANSDETQLRVQRAIEHNNETEWRDVVGDDISATAELATTLENQQRYRLVISNDVQTRILGSYTPSGAADPETIPIGRIDFQGDSSQGTTFDAALVNETQPGVQVMYRDPDTVADSLTYRIQNTTTENSSVVVGNTTIDSPDAFTSVTEALPSDATVEDSTYRVELWAHAEDGSLIEKRSAAVGQLSGPGWGDGVNNGVLTLTGYLLLVGIGYGAGNYNPKIGVLAAVIIGASLTIFNVVAIPHVVLGFTGTIALIVNAADRT